MTDKDELSFYDKRSGTFEDSVPDELRERATLYQHHLKAEAEAIERFTVDSLRRMANGLAIKPEAPLQRNHYFSNIW